MFARRHARPDPRGYAFTDRTRRVLQLARDEAHRLNHEYVGTEHILLGIVRDGGGVACVLLRNLLSIDLHELRAVAESAAGRGGARTAAPDLPYTSAAKRVIEFAMEEPRTLNHSHVGTEHLLLGLLAAEEAGLGPRVLGDLGLTLSRARGETRRLLATWPQSATKPEPSPVSAEPAPRFRVQIDDASPFSIYEQIVAQIQEAVATQRLRPGDRLATVRQLADQLDIAPGTVARAYGELERLGVVVTEGARGTRVAERRERVPKEAANPEALVGLLRPVAVAAFHLGATAEQLRKALEQAMKGIFGS